MTQLDHIQELKNSLSIQNDILINKQTGQKLGKINEELFPVINEFVTHYVQNEMEKSYNFIRVPIPKENMSYIYMNKDALENPFKLLILIQGLGDIRPGVWSMRLCVEESLKTGSMLCCIEYAQKNNYSIIIMNPNQNKYEDIERDDGKETKVEKLIPGNNTRENHALYVYDNFISKAKAKHVCIIGHSAGGRTCLDLLHHRGSQIILQLRAIALADSRMVVAYEMDKVTKAFWSNNASIWAASNVPINTAVTAKEMLSTRTISAGTDDHDKSITFAMTFMFRYFEDKIYQVNNGKKCSIM